MDTKQFGLKSPGRLVSVTLKERVIRSGIETLNEFETKAFVPNPLPPTLDWSEAKAALFDIASEATLALGRVNGLHKRVGGAATLLRTLWMREAKMSSEVEGIETTAEEMVLAGAGRTTGVRGEARESWNYVKALEHGARSELPLCTRLIKQMHAQLLQGVRGADLRPGEFRAGSVFIGDPERGPRHARFIPCPGGEMLEESMQRLERFVHQTKQEIPPLFAIALMHYQFEAIHPFRDGNGRIGRVLISRSLVKEGFLEHPTVYMSAYIHKHKKAYVDGLLRVSTDGAWIPWIEFMLRAIQSQAVDTIERSEKLIALRERYHERLKDRNAPGRLFRLVDRLFNLPAINAQEARELLEVEKKTIYQDLEVLERANIIKEYTGKKRNRDWLAPGIMEIIKAEKASMINLDQF